MATHPPLTPAVDPAVAAIEGRAANALAKALAEAESAPAPATEPTPPAEPVASPEPTEPAAQPAPEPATPAAEPGVSAPAVDADALSPEARSYLEEHGGDVNRALSAALEARRGKEPAPSPAEVTPPGEAPGAPPAAPPKVPVLDQQILGKALAEALRADPDCERMLQSYDANTARIAEIDKERPKLDFDIQFLERRLQDEDVKADPSGLGADFKDQIRDLKDLRQERRQLQAENNSLNNDFKARTREHRAAIIEHYTAQAEQKREAEDREAAVESYAATLDKEWGPALSRVLKAFPGLEPNSFERRAQHAVLALLDLGYPPEDLDDFFTSEATEMQAEHDRSHRAKAVVHAAASHNRQPGSPSAPPTPAAKTPAAKPPASLDEVYKATQQRLQQAMTASR